MPQTFDFNDIAKPSAQTLDFSDLAKSTEKAKPKPSWIHQHIVDPAVQAGKVLASPITGYGINKNLQPTDEYRKGLDVITDWVAPTTPAMAAANVGGEAMAEVLSRRAGQLVRGFVKTGRAPVEEVVRQDTKVPSPIYQPPAEPKMLPGHRIITPPKTYGPENLRPLPEKQPVTRQQIMVEGLRKDLNPTPPVTSRQSGMSTLPPTMRKQAGSFYNPSAEVPGGSSKAVSDAIHDTHIAEAQKRLERLVKDARGRQQKVADLEKVRTKAAAKQKKAGVKNPTPPPPKIEEQVHSGDLQKLNYHIEAEREHISNLEVDKARVQQEPKGPTDRGVDEHGNTNYRPFHPGGASLPKPQMWSGFKEWIQTVRDRSKNSWWRTQEELMGKYDPEAAQRHINYTADIPKYKAAGGRIVDNKEVGYGFHKFSERQRQKIADLIESGKIPQNPRTPEEKAAKALHTHLQDNGRGLQADGATILTRVPRANKQTGAIEIVDVANPFVPIEHYWPHRDSIARIRASGAIKIANGFRRLYPDMKPEEALELGQEYVQYAEGKLPPNGGKWLKLQQLQGSTYKTLAHTRQFPKLPWEVRHDPLEEFRIYNEEYSEQRAWMNHYTRLQPGAELLPLDKRHMAVEDLWAKDIAKVKDYGDQQKALEIYRRERNIMNDPHSAKVLDAVVGRLGNIASLVYISPLTTIKHLQRPVAAFAKFWGEGGNSSAINLAKGLLKAFTKDGKIEADKLGVGLRLYDGIWMAARNGDEGKIIQILGKEFQPTLEKATSLKIKATGIPFVDTYFRRGIALGAKLDIEELQRAATAGNAKAAEKLERFHGLNPNATAEDVARKATEWSDRMSPTPGVRYEAFLTGMPITRSFMTLQRWHMGYAKLIQREFISPIITNPTSVEAWRTFLLFAAGTGAFGEAITDIKDFVTSKVSGVPPATPGGSLREFLGDVVSGRAPLSVIGERMAWDLAYGGMTAMFGPAGTLMTGLIQQDLSYGRPRVAPPIYELVSSAAAGTINSAVKIVTDGLRTLTTSGKSQTSAVKAFTRDMLMTAGGSLAAGPGALAEHDAFVAEIARAKVRGDLEKVHQLRLQYYKRAGKHITDTAIDKMMKQMGLR